MKRLEVELSDCIECGICADVCPEIFTITEAGYVDIVDDPTKYPEADIDEVIMNCPADCITWEDGA